MILSRVWQKFGKSNSYTKSAVNLSACKRPRGQRLKQNASTLKMKLTTDIEPRCGDIQTEPRAQ